MDKLTQYLLSIGIAVLFPIVVVFGVFTAIPQDAKVDVPRYPTRPRCYNDYNSTLRRSVNTCTTEVTQKYEEDKDAYDDAIENNRKARQDDDEKNLIRAEIALAVSIIAFVGAVWLKDQSKELSAGLVLGAATTIIGAVGVLAAYQDINNSDRLVASSFILVGFVVLTAVLAIVDKMFPKEPQPTGSPKFSSEEEKAIKSEHIIADTKK